MRCILVFLFSFITITHYNILLANQEGSVMGIVIDEKDEKPLSNSNVLLFKLPDDIILDADATDSLGVFSFQNLKKGYYKIVITHLGYQQISIDSIIISDSSVTLNLGKISLVLFDIELETVTVTGEKPKYEFNNGVLKVNVDKLKSNDSETITDILRKIPFIYVQGNDRIYLNGNSHPEILLNGRKSSFTQADILSQTSVQDVGTIEISLIPSSEFDAENSGGIINIISKNNLLDQFRVNTKLSAGNLGYFRATIDLNYYESAFRFYGGYKNYYNSDYGTMSSATKYYITDLFNRSSFSNWNSRSNLNFFNLGVDYQFNENSTISALGTFNMRLRENTNDELTHFVTKLDSDLVNKLIEVSSSNNLSNVNEYLLNYTFNSQETGQLFKLDLFHSNVGNDSYSDFNGNFPIVDSVSYDHQDENIKTSFNSLAIDYQYKFSYNNVFQTGFKSIIRERVSDFFQYYLIDNINDSINYNATNDNFNLKDQIHSLYISYSDSYDKMNYKLGLRGEYVRFSGHQVETGILLNDSYFDLFPSISISYNFTQDNKITLGYNRNINRPFLLQYNPFLRQNSSYSFSSGNPSLKPTYSDRLNVIKMLEFFEIPFNLSIQYIKTKDAVGQPSILKADGTYISKAENNEDVTSVGFSINSFVEIMKDFTLSFFTVYNKDFYTTQIYTGEQPEIIKFKNDFYIVRFNFWAKLLWDINTYFDVSILSGFNTSQSRRSNSLMSDFTIKKNFFENTLNLSLSISNFIQKKNTYEYSYSDYISKSQSSPGNVLILFSISYNFNQFSDQKTRKPSEDNGALE